MIKNIFLSAVTLILILGCSDKEESKSQEKTAPQEALKIEVVKNENAKEIKVEQKENKNKKNETYYFNYKEAKSNYDPNSQPANKDAKIRLKPRTVLDANMHVRSPYEKVKISMIVKSLSKEFILKCSACHNDYANGIIGPSLLDKDATYIFNKIMKFKSSESENVLMSGLVNQMKEEEIKTIADEIYRFNQEIRNLK